jgi:hypothetical protein
MVINEIYTGAGTSVTLIPERDILLSINFGITKGSKQLLETSVSQTTLSWAGSADILVPNIYRGCMAKLDRYTAAGASEDYSQTLMIESNTINSLVFSQALDTTGAFWYECTILAFGAPVYAPAILANKPNLLADNWLGLVTSFTAPSVDAELKQMNLAVSGGRNFDYQFKGSETIGEASIDVSLNNGSWLYYALGTKSITHTGSSNTLASSLVAGASYAEASNGTVVYRVESGEILPPFASTTSSSDSVNSITITNDGLGIPFAASQTLTIAGSATATYALTKDKHEFTCAAKNSSGTENYNGLWIKIAHAAATNINNVFWFDVDNSGTTVPSHGISGANVVEINTINTGDGGETIATKIATAINAVTGLTATSLGAVLTVECTNGGVVDAMQKSTNLGLTSSQLVEGGEIASVTITNAGSGYGSVPAITNVTGTTAATFTAILGNSEKTGFKEITGVVTYDITENDSGDLPSFALEVTNEKAGITDANYSVDADKQSIMSRVFTGCQVNSLTLNFEEGQDVTASISAMSRKAHDTETGYVPKRQVRTASALNNYNSNDDNNPYLYSDGTIKIYGQTLARIKSGSIAITNNITPHRFIGNYDRTISASHTAGQRTYEINLNLLITDRKIWDELRNQNETDSSVGLIEIEFAKSSTDKIILKFDNYLTTSVDIPFPDDKGALEVNLICQARTLNNCTYQGKWIILG